MDRPSSEDFGDEERCYRTLPPSHPSSPGYQGLVVTLRVSSPEFSSGIETLHVHLRDEDGLATWRTLRQGSDVASPSFLCPGRLTLCEQSDQRIVFFSFGGILERDVQLERTVYEIRSPAPVLGVTFPSQAFSAQLAAETEALLAEAEARWEPDNRGFLRRLAQLDPLRCYQGVLQSLHSRYEEVAALREALWPLYEIIHREREWFMETRRWPDDVVGLEELLGPP